jgi:hypothetical protein
VALHERRYSPWLLNNEESLTRRRERSSKLTVFAGVAVALLETLWPWQAYTPAIPAWMHIAATALLLVTLYFMLQGDYQRKLAAMTTAMDDLGRRLYFLDPHLNSEQFEMLERFSGSALQPTQRQLEQIMQVDSARSLRVRIDYYFRAMPTHVLEEDRLGLLSMLHPRTALSWGIALLSSWFLMPRVLNLPLLGLSIGSSQGLTFLPLLLVVYLLATRANSRFAYELALYNWLRLG